MGIRRRGEAGASAVEFALVLPLLVLLLVGIFAFGLGFARWVALTGAAREGARYMAIHSAEDVNAAADAIVLARSSAWLACGSGGADCTVPTPVPTCGPTTDDVTFTITASRFSPIEIPFIPGVNLAAPVTAQAVMQCGG